MPLEIKSALVCDDFREEKTGKYIIIGVYTGEIILLEKPATFAPLFWVEFVPFVQDADMEFEVKFEAPGLKKPRITSVKMEIERQNTVLLALRTRPVEIADAGILKLSMRPKGGRRWAEVLAIRVRFSDLPCPSS